MAFPKNRQQFFIRNQPGIEIYLHGLRMIAQVMISRVLGGSPGISYPGAHHAFEDPEPGVRTPESAQGKGRSFGFGWRRLIDWGYRGSNRHRDSFLGPLPALTRSRET